MMLVLAVQCGVHKLVSQRRDRKVFAKKVKKISLAHLHAELLLRGLPKAAGINSQRVIGHFTRRSEAKSWAKEGIPLFSMQRMSRHSSSLIMDHVEAAWAENI